MNPKVMIWISVALSALAQIFLKQGLTSFQSRRVVGKGFMSSVLGIARQICVWLWAFCFVVAMALWLVGLRKLDLSYAYPLVSVGYVIVSVLSAVFFRERVDRYRWLSVAIISLGVGLIAGS